MKSVKYINVKSNKGFLKGFLSFAFIVILIVVIIIVVVKNLFISGNINVASDKVRGEIVNELRGFRYENINVTTQVICESQEFGIVVLDVCINADNAFGEHEEITELATVQIEDGYAEIVSEDEYPKELRDFYISEYKKAFEETLNEFK